MRKRKLQKEFLNSCRAALEAKAADFSQSRHRADLREEIPSRVPQNAADFAAGNTFQEIAVSLSESDSRMHGLVKAALARLEAEEYGFCQECDQPIPRKRLEAVPWAPFCIPCQKMLEDERHAAADESDVVYAT